MEQEMTSDELLKYMGVDGKKWAEKFKEINPCIDEGMMIGWFANAIEAGKAYKGV